jgi:hypothetical protein
MRTTEGADCACFPAPGLGHLAALRTRPGLRVLVRDGRAWLFWAEDEEVTRAALAVCGAELFCRRGGHWYRRGEHLPAFAVPDAGEARPLAALLAPAPVRPEACEGRPAVPLPLRVVREEAGVSRAATALRCPAAALRDWAARATSSELAALSGARCGDEVLLRGARLPALAGAERYWGATVLVPLGFRPEPSVAEAVLAEALGVRSADEVCLFGPDGAEVIPNAAFGPVTRAGLRLLVY